MKMERTNEWMYTEYAPAEEENLKKFRSLGRIVICLMMLLALAVGMTAPKDAELQQEAEWSQISSISEDAPVELGDHSPIH